MIQIAQAGLFKEIFDKNYEKLCLVAFRVVKDQDEARDIVQQVLCDFWDNRKKWPEIQSYSAYLYTSVYRFSLLSHKKSKILKNGNLLHEDGKRGYTPPDELAYKELEEQIVRAINDLPPKCREIFLLSREEELSYKEIAAHLRISVKTVEAQMGIALKRLKVVFSKTEHGSIFFSIFF